MAKAKKTVQVEAIRERVNNLLTIDNEHVTADFRKGAASVLETVLHAANAYRGFQYNAWSEGGYTRWQADGEPKDKTPYLGDQTKRYYY